MNFSFVSGSDELHAVRSWAVTLRKQYADADIERKRIMKKAREDGDTELHRLMSKVRGPAWYAIVDCERCPQLTLISSKEAAATRFACHGCHKPASLSWVEEDSRHKVETMYEKYIDKEATKAREKERH